MNPAIVSGAWATIPRVPLIDPNQLDHIVPFKQFCDYLRQTHSRSHFTDEELQKRYDEYKEKISAKQLAQFFNNNKEKQWFMEKYHPNESKDRVGSMKQRRKDAFNNFMEALKNGKYDTVQYDIDGKEALENNDNDENATTDNKPATTTTNENNNTGSNEEYENQLVIKTVPPTISRQKITDMCNKVDGFQYLALSEPSPNKKFHRIGWIHFSEETNMQQVFEQLNNQKIDDFIFHLAMNRKNQQPSGNRSGKTAPEIANTSERLALDLEQATQLAKVLDAELNVNGIQDIQQRAQQVLDQLDDNKKEGDLKIKKELDMTLAYLRYVHMYCYYCGLECDSSEELGRKCLDPHHRKLPITTNTNTTDSKQNNKNERISQQWAKNLDQRIRLKINPPDDDEIVKIGGKSVKSEIDAYINEHIQKEHDAKFKCKVGDCAKAFKGVEFVEKHILSKHNEEIQRIKDEATFYNNYVCDPNHLLPTPNANSNNNNNNNTMPGTNGMFSSPSFMMTPPGVSMTPTSMGTPWDHIPRIGFGGNVGWPTSMAGQLGSTRINKATVGSNIDTLMDMPQDPRQVKSYVDLDAPSDGDANISFY
ncbi:hypothetical protein BJ944DRAFT_232205 [Cunninghamella echinulata]|nr:hypothetical protein BJ944DRAFT_232205 [Cunninghamella echinulata]